jgi:hypothetical protein
MIEHRALLVRAAGLEPVFAAVGPNSNQFVLRDHRFEREPPQFAHPIGEARRHKNGERHLVFLEDRIGEFQVVAIAVVEGNGDEATGEIAIAQPPMDFVE